MSEPAAPPPKDTLPRVLGPWTAYAMIVGSVIGSGIFIVPASVARDVPSIGGIFILWVAAGLFSLAGALTLAELGAMLPHAGGPYVYLREGFGRWPAFMFGWTEFLVIRAGSVATLATGFALNFRMVVPPPGGLSDKAWQAIVASVVVAILALINVRGTRLGGGIQVTGTALKVGSLVAMIVLPWLLWRIDFKNLSPGWPAAFDGTFLRAGMAAVVGILWTYDGWVNTSALAEEIKDPGRSIPKAAITGMLTLIAVYLGVTMSYHLVLPMERVAMPPEGQIVAGVFFRELFGPPGLLMIATVIMISIFISLNGNALTGPRAYFAMARDGLFPQFLRHIHPRFHTPANAILTQAGWAITLILLGAFFQLNAPPSSGLPGWALSAWARLNETPLYDVLYSYVIFGGTVIYSLTVASVFVLRAKRPDLERPYRTWGYPITPLVYLAASGLLMWSMLTEPEKRFQSLAGLAIIALSLPAYLYFEARSAKHRGESPEI